jgi:Zn-dependent protease with chaperone function
MPETFPAVCFLAAAAGSRPCRVTLDSGGLLIEPHDGPSVRWPYPTLECEPGGEEHDWVFVSRSDADSGVTSLAVRDPEAIAALAARTTGPAQEILAGFAARRRRHADRRRRGLAAGVLAVALLAAAGWLFLTRLAPELVARTLPPASERPLGEAAAARLLAGERLIDAGPAADAVRSIMERLEAAIEANPGYVFDVTVVKSDLVNAAALPGGKVVVYSGLLAEAGSAEEVAGVLAHEICHVLHRDSLRQLISRLGSGALMGLVLGGGDLAALAARAGELDHLAYGREQERAADRGAVAILARAGLPPRALPAFFERLQAKEAGRLPEFLSTHPDTAGRIAELRRLAADTPVAEPRPLAIDWQAVRASLE